MPDKHLKNSDSYLSNRHESYITLASRFISDTFNPLVLPPVLFALSLYLTGYEHHQVLNIFLIALVFFTIIPIAIIYYFKSRNYIQNFDISDLSERRRPFVVIIFSYSLGLLAFITWFGSGHLLPVYLTLCYIINAVVGLLITTKWKISIHSAGIASFSSALFFLHNFRIIHDDFFIGQIFIWLSFILIPIIMWARIHLEEHTFAQTLAGALIGFTITYLQLSIMMR